MGSSRLVVVACGWAQPVETCAPAKPLAPPWQSHSCNQCIHCSPHAQCPVTGGSREQVWVGGELIHT